MRVQLGGETFEVSERIARMLALVIATRAEIERHAVGEVELHFAERQVKIALRISLAA